MPRILVGEVTMPRNFLSTIQMLKESCMKLKEIYLEKLFMILPKALMGEVFGQNVRVKVFYKQQLKVCRTPRLRGKGKWHLPWNECLKPMAPLSKPNL